MQQPISYYNERIKILEQEIQKNRSALNLISFLRLSVFVGTVLLVYLFFENSYLASAIAIVGISLFLLLLKMYVSRKHQYNFNKELKAINEEEIKILDNDYLERFDGSEFDDTMHFFSSDIDLFGRGSFFQYTNRTGLTEGTKKLVELLTANSICDVEKRQAAIKELSGKNEWRQKYTAIARTIESETSNESIIQWLNNYKPFLPGFYKWVVMSFGLVSTLLILALVLKLINPLLLLCWFLFGLALTLVYVRKVNVLSLKTSRIKETIQQYGQLLDIIEGTEFISPLLKEEKDKIRSKELMASRIFKNFSKVLDALDNRNNLIVALVGNGLFLWDIQCSLKIEKWILKYRDTVDQWFATIAFFDAFNSFATFAYNHPNFAYPDIRESNTVSIDIKSLGHPLIPYEDRVTSDLILDSTDFFIITGANMAGKSTFLRSVSLFIIMANAGIPVCAEKSYYKPTKLITSMRTSDSLTDNSSYFFAELKRLQFIVKQLQKDSYLVVLDEILKGTNSIDKAAGSKKLIEKLVEMGVSGIIATHDLSLCKISDSLESVKNYFFETEIRDDELFFDYKLKQGVCKNMNASFLLRKMNIT